LKQVRADQTRTEIQLVIYLLVTGEPRNWNWK
jgi:hypothetical protein